MLPGGRPVRDCCARGGCERGQLPRWLLEGGQLATKVESWTCIPHIGALQDVQLRQGLIFTGEV